MAAVLRTGCERPSMESKDEKKPERWEGMKAELGNLTKALPVNVISIYRIPDDLRSVNRDPYNCIPEDLRRANRDPYYRIREDSRSANRDPYTPRIASIGPYLHGDPKLQAMERHKWYYMLVLLHRENDAEGGKGFDKFASYLDSKLESIRLSYSGEINMEDDKLAQVIFRDACFILELFLRSWWLDFRDEVDPIFKNAWMLPALEHDLALLENQIPFSVLEKLYEIILPRAFEKLPKFLICLALNFFHLEPQNMVGKSSAGPSHLLDLLHESYLPKRCKTSKESEGPTPHLSIDLGRVSNDTKMKVDQLPSDTDEDICPNGNEKASSSPDVGKHGCWGFNCFKRTKIKKKEYIWGSDHRACKLFAAGVGFKRHEGVPLLDLRFDEGVLKIPPLCIDEFTEGRFRNLIAFERCSVQTEHPLTSYVFIMKCLLRKPRDVKLLKNKGIITTEGPENGEDFGHIVALFERLLKEVVGVREYFYSDFSNLCGRVDEYTAKKCRAHRLCPSLQVWFMGSWASLINNYFSSPWRCLQVFVAFVLLVFTGIQTVNSFFR